MKYITLEGVKYVFCVSLGGELVLASEALASIHDITRHRYHIYPYGYCDWYAYLEAVCPKKLWNRPIFIYAYSKNLGFKLRFLHTFKVWLFPSFLRSLFTKHLKFFVFHFHPSTTAVSLFFFYFIPPGLCFFLDQKTQDQKWMT